MHRKTSQLLHKLLKPRLWLLFWNGFRSRQAEDALDTKNREKMRKARQLKSWYKSGCSIFRQLCTSEGSDTKVPSSPFFLGNAKILFTRSLAHLRLHVCTSNPRKLSSLLYGVPGIGRQIGSSRTQSMCHVSHVWHVSHVSNAMSASIHQGHLREKCIPSELITQERYHMQPEVSSHKSSCLLSKPERKLPVFPHILAKAVWNIWIKLRSQLWLVARRHLGYLSCWTCAIKWVCPIWLNTLAGWKVGYAKKSVDWRPVSFIFVRCSSGSTIWWYLSIWTWAQIFFLRSDGTQKLNC